MDSRLKRTVKKVLGKGRPDFGRIVDAVVDDWRAQYDAAPAAKVIAELGTGAYPTIALCWYLAGATTIFTPAQQEALAIADRLAAHAPLIARTCGRDVEPLRRALVEALRRRDLVAATNRVVRRGAPANVDLAFGGDDRSVVRPGGVLFHDGRAIQC